MFPFDVVAGGQGGFVVDYSQTIESLNARPNLLAGEVADVEELNRTVASELATELRTAIGLGRKLVVIAPVGPLDYIGPNC